MKKIALRLSLIFISVLMYGFSNNGFANLTPKVWTPDLFLGCYPGQYEYPAPTECSGVKFWGAGGTTSDRRITIGTKSYTFPDGTTTNWRAITWRGSWWNGDGTPNSRLFSLTEVSRPTKIKAYVTTPGAWSYDIAIAAGTSLSTLDTLSRTTIPNWATSIITADYMEWTNSPIFITGTKVPNSGSGGFCICKIVLEPYLPELSVSPDALNSYYQEGFGPGSKQYFLVNGAYLESEVTVTSPTNYEISLDGVSFQTTPITITHVNHTLVNKPVYFRLVSGLTVGQYNGNITVSTNGISDVYVALTGRVGSTPPLPNVIINEFYADAVVDANNDGAISASNDQFVELYNGASALVNMSFMKLKVNGVVKHIFPVGTTVQPHASIVVFGGGSVTNFTATQAAVASAGSLNLPTTGGTITLTNQNDAVIATYTYSAEANNDQSITRDPDGEGAFVQHSNAAFAAGAMLSPGLRNNGMVFSGGISNAVPINWKYIFAAFLLIGLVVVIRRVRFF